MSAQTLELSPLGVERFFDSKGMRGQWSDDYKASNKWAPPSPPPLLLQPLIRLLLLPLTPDFS